MRPLLQLAIDEISLEEAYELLNTGVDEIVDIIECGTVLLASEGKKALISIREKYPNRKLVCDFKIADAGKKITSLFLEAKPDYLTVICSAHDKTIKAIMDEIKERKLDTKIQIELYGNWNFKEINNWKELGIKHVIFHHATDDNNPWNKQELAIIKALCDEGLDVSITGGINLDNLILFKDLSLFSIIIGRSIKKASNPKLEAQKIKDKIYEIWKE